MSSASMHLEGFDGLDGPWGRLDFLLQPTRQLFEDSSREWQAGFNIATWCSLVLGFVDNGTLDSGYALHNHLRQHLHEALQLEQQWHLTPLLSRRMDRDVPKFINPATVI